jgi:hypothetical protein
VNKWQDFFMEQQAMIVENWFGVAERNGFKSKEALNDPTFPTSKATSGQARRDRRDWGGRIPAGSHARSQLGIQFRSASCGGAGGGAGCGLGSGLGPGLWAAVGGLVRDRRVGPSAES